MCSLPHPPRTIFILAVVCLLFIECHSKAIENDDVVSPWRSSESEDSLSSVKVEHRSAADADSPIRSLSFYGGAKGKYLLIHPSGRTTITTRDPSYYGLKADSEYEENVGMEEGETEETENTNSTTGSGSGGGGGSPGGSGPDESVAIGLPADNASVAEAKPVGLAVAGPGGVASSRPVGTAVVGPGGLALSKPIATAIAGIPGSEALVGIPGLKKKHERPLKMPFIGHKEHNNNNGNITKNGDEQTRRSFDIHNEVAASEFDYGVAESTDEADKGRRGLFIPLHLPALTSEDSE